MFTEYKKSRSWVSMLKSTLIVILLVVKITLLPSETMAQVSPLSVTVNVMPPYTSSLYDYISTPNKIIVIVTNNQITGSDVNIYVKAWIKSENGIKISTESGFKPSEPIILEPGKSLIINNQNNTDAFNLNHITTEGIELNELVSGAGLPDDYYQICIQVYDYNTDRLLTGEQPLGCSNVFHIVSNLEPPTVTTPNCGDHVNESAIQFVQISWTIPAEALIGTLYHFEMVEIPDNSTIDPRAAFESSAFPPFYEETTTLSTLSLAIQKVVLTPGYTYAFRVRAEDPSGRMHFRNDGYSEVCSFVYGEKPVTPQPDTNVLSDKRIKFISPKDCNADSVLIASPLQEFYTSWRVMTLDELNAMNNNKRSSKVNKLNELNKSLETFEDPLADLPGYVFRVDFFDGETAQKPILTTTTNKTFFQADPMNDKLPFVSGQKYWIQVSLEKSALSGRGNSFSKSESLKIVDAADLIPASDRCGFKYIYSSGVENGMIAHTVSGNLSYLFEKQGSTKYPVVATQIKLSCHYVLTDGATGKQIDVPESEVLKYLAKVENQIAQRANMNTKLEDNSLEGLKNKSILPLNLTSSPVATATTSEKGSFVFNYSWPEDVKLGEVIPKFSYDADMDGIFTGRVDRVLKIDVVNLYYSSPEKVIMLNQPDLDLGEVVTNVGCYELKATLSKGYKQNLGFKENLEGKTVYIFRKKKLPGIPVFEGDRLKANQIMNIPAELKSAGYYLVATGRAEAAANDKGEKSSIVTFQRLIENTINGDEYYWYVGGYDLASAQPFSFYHYDNGVIKTGDFSFQVNTSFTVISNDPPMSGIKGRLVYEFPGKPGNPRPLASRSISVVSCLVTDEPGGVSKIVLNNQFEEYSGAFPWEHVLATKTTDPNGNFDFQFANIAWNEVDPKSGTFRVSTGKLNRKETWQAWESYPEKCFRIVYENKSVKVKRVLRLVVNDPTGLFMSPDDNLKINPLETVDVGTLTSNVMSYCLKGNVYWNKPGQGTGYGTDATAIIDLSTLTPIQGVDCYVLRQQKEVDQYQLPSDEGQNIVGSLTEMPNFKIVGKTTSDTQGNITYDNLLFRNALAPIYLFFKTNEIGDANYEPTTMNQSGINAFAQPTYLFNSDYNYTTITAVGAIMKPKLPTLKGKVTSNVAAGKGVKDATCEMYVFFNTFIQPVKYSQNTDAEGYFNFSYAFESDVIKNNLKDLKIIAICVNKKGFHYMENGKPKTYYTNTFDKANFVAGRQTVLPIPLYGDGSITGTVVNEKGDKVDAYVQFIENRSKDASSVGGEGDIAKTMEFSGSFGQMVKGVFNIPAIPGMFRKLAIIPKDVVYFSDTLNIIVKENSDTDLGNIKVFERSHRISFLVYTTIVNGNIRQNVPLKDAKVTLIGSPNPVEAISDSKGRVTMSFNNVSETNLSVSVNGPAGGNYVPKVMSFTNYESDKVIELPMVILDKGLTLKGKVLLDGKPTSDAEIYVSLGYQNPKTWLDGDAVTESQDLFKTYPKADGTFEINTIPAELKGKQIYIKTVYKKSATLPVKALDPNKKPDKSENTLNLTPTVVGEEKLVSVPDASGNLVLNMKTFSAMQITDVWGFPLEITKILPQQYGNNFFVWGRVKLDGYCPGFDPLEALTLEINNVEFKPSAQLNNGVPVGIPYNNNVTVDMKRSLKMKYAKAFNVKLRAPGNSTLSILKNSDGTTNGSVNATVAIVDNSFQYPSSYLNFDNTNFNFCNKLNGANNSFYMNPVIKVFSSSKTGNGNDVVKYNLCNLGSGEKAEDLKFKFINFDTYASTISSTIEGPEITLDATLKANMKDAGEVEVKIGKLVLKNNAIAAVSGDTPIMIELKDGGVHDAAKAWKFEARNWRIDPKMGGLISENCILHTGTIDIPYSYFNLRSQFAYLGNPDKTKINIGGYHIDMQPGSEVKTGYNPSCGGDKAGHWQLIFYPNANGDTPAVVKDLPNMGGVPLELETVSLLSNGENVFSIGTGVKPMKLYNTVDFKPQTAFSLSDGFVLSGSSSFHIPRVRDGVGTRLVFAKSSTKPIPTVDPIDLGFDGKGNIKFITNPDGQVFEQAFDKSKRTFTTLGTVQEPGVLNPIQVKLTYTDNDTKNMIKTEIVESPSASKQKVLIGEKETTYLEKVTCKTKADQTDWDLFVFEGDLTGAKGVSATSNRHMKFTVYGEIKGEKDGFKADGIDNSFGGMQITYRNGGLIGTLTMTNFPLGSSIVNGVANILMDSDGWAFYANCRASNVPAPDPCTVYMGILIGNYKVILPEMQSTVLAYALNKEMPKTFTKDGLKGFYMVGGRELPITGLDIGINVVVASAYVRVPVAAIDASYYMNFAGPSTIGMGLTGKIALEFGLGSITCTDLTGAIDAIVYVTGAVSDSGLVLTGGAGFNLTLHVSQGIPYLVGCIDAIDIPVSIGGGFDFGVNPTTVKFHL